MKTRIRKIISVLIIAAVILPAVNVYAADTSVNNIIGRALVLNVNADITGSIRGAADANYYKASLAQPGSVIIDFSVSGAIDGGNWTVMLYDADERPLQMSRVGLGGVINGARRVNRLDKQRLAAGDYYIKVVAHSASALNTEEYRLRLDYTPESSRRFEKEPNNSIETANELLLNAPVIANLNNHEDYDYFKFNVAEFADIRIEFSSPGSLNRAAWTVYLFDDRGAVASYDLGQSGTMASGRRLFTGELLELNPGLYYIAVFTHDLSAESYSNEDYTLCVRADGAPVPLIIDDEQVYMPTEIPEEAVGVNRDFTGAISSGADVHRYNFGLNYNGVIYASISSPASVTRQSWILNIFDTNGRLIFTGRFGGEALSEDGTARVGGSNIIRVPAGSYYAQVLPIDAYNYSREAYRLRITYLAESAESMGIEREVYESEFNNTPETANELELAHTRIGNMSDYTDIDYFKVNLGSNGRLVIDFETLQSVNSNVWVVDLLDYNLNVIYYKSFGADGVPELDYIDERVAHKQDSSAPVRLPAGEYYIRVRAASNIHFSNSDYRLTVNFNAETPGYYYFETEFNDTPETATPLLVNTDIKANTANNADLDYFKINIDGRKDVQIKFTTDYNINNNYWFLRIYDQDLSELYAFRFGEGGTFTADGLFKYFKTQRVNLDAGDYYILIRPFSDQIYSDAEYILKVMDEAGQKIDIYNFEEDSPSIWARREVEFAYGYNLVPPSYLRDFGTAIKRGEFCELAIKFIEAAEGRPISEVLSLRDISVSYDNYDVFIDTSEPYILAAHALGIVTGRGSGIFDPSGNITREEAATMLRRLGMLANINLNIAPLNFNDTQTFSLWASEAIIYVSSCIDKRGNRVMNGYADGGFHPGDSYSREQAYMTLFRLYAIKAGV